MKKIIVLMLLLILTSNVYAGHIYSYEETIPISKSITLTNVRSFYSDRNISYSYIKADLTDQNTSLKLLTPEGGVDTFDTVLNLSKSEENVVAALNADFFSTYSGGKGFSLGIEIKEGELLQSPIYPGTMATIAYIDEKVLMSYLDFHIMAVAPNWQYQEVRHLNKHTSYYGDILMYTSEFNDGMSPAPGGDVVEVVVSGGKVQEFRRNMPPVEIPEDGCVLVVSEGSTMFLANNFNVGDEIKFDYYITPDISSADAAFGGGAMLVREGKAVDSYSHEVAGNNPRSAIGIDKEGKTLYLVAVNGRQEESLGMRMSALADLMVSLGCYTAINLDGGGSTNMVASTAVNGELHTVNSPSENRKVSNAVGITYDKPAGSPHGIIIKKDSDNVFVGQTVNVSASVYDENLRPVNGDVVWSASSGIINNGIFTADKEGKVTITASCGDAVATTEVYVVDNISGIVADGYIDLEVGKTAVLNFDVFDETGRYVKVTNFSPFSITSSDFSVVSVSGNKIIAKKSGNAIIAVKKNGVTSYTSVYVKGEEPAPNRLYETLPADFNSGTGITAISRNRLRVGAILTNDDLMSRFVNNKVEAQVFAAEKGVLIGEQNSFSATNGGKSLYINLVTSGGGIRNSGTGQWDKMVAAINSTTKKNIFIMSNTSIFGNSDFENEVIIDYLASLDKNVFVITGGTEDSYMNIKGVNYFTLMREDKEKLSATRLSNYKYLEFDVGDEVKFEWKKTF